MLLAGGWLCAGCGESPAFRPAPARQLHVFLAEIRPHTPDPRATFVLLNTGPEPRRIASSDLASLASEATLQHPSAGRVALAVSDRNPTNRASSATSRESVFETVLEPHTVVALEVSFHGTVSRDVSGTATVYLEGSVRTASLVFDAEIAHQLRLVNVLHIREK